MKKRTKRLSIDIASEMWRDLKMFERLLMAREEREREQREAENQMRRESGEEEK